MADRMMNGALNKRLTALERRAGETRGRVESGQPYDFIVTPTCPPGVAVEIRPGSVSPNYAYGDWQDTTYIPAASCDFTATADTNYLCNFANSGYFVGILLCYRDMYLLDLTEPQPYTIVGGATEYASAQEAESEIDALLNGSSAWMYDLFPLRAIVLRNNGTIGIDGQILPIDAVNRGRSYLWRDIRPRNFLLR